MRHSILHNPSPHRNQSYSILKIYGPGGNKRGIFSKAVACEKGRFYRHLLLHTFKDCHAGGQYCRLGVLCKIKRFNRSFETEPRHIKMKEDACLFKYLPRSSILLMKLPPHAYILRTLSGENKCKCSVFTTDH